MKRNRVWCAWTILGFLSASAGAVDWPQFRGPKGQGVADASGVLPYVWNDELNVAWKSVLPGFGASSPIVLGDRVYLTCYSGYGLDPEPTTRG